MPLRDVYMSPEAYEDIMAWFPSLEEKEDFSESVEFVCHTPGSHEVTLQCPAGNVFFVPVRQYRRKRRAGKMPPCKCSTCGAMRQLLNS